jgi:chitin disaccharide deacetylase
MTKLVINADDFGYSKGVNLGIIEAYQHGVVSSTTMMVNMPGAAHAAALALAHPGLGVGIHLVLDCGYPVHPSVPSLVDETGRFYKMNQLLEKAKLSDIEKELQAQIEQFFAHGLSPTHLDGHHHVHGREKIYPFVEKLAKDYKLPIRKVSADANHSSNQLLQTTQTFLYDFYGDELTPTSLIDLVMKSTHFESAEIMCHPAYIDEAVLTGSSYNVQRARELAILTDPEVKQVIEENHIELVTYKEVIK